MPDPPPRDALVLRFPPGGLGDERNIRKEAKWADRAHRKEFPDSGPRFRLSVWTDFAREGETDAQLKQRLLDAAGTDGIRIDDDRNSVLWWSTAGALYDAGFTLVKDAYPEEPSEHWSVDLGSDELTRARAFAAVFGRSQQNGEATS
jgi:hypothetical protein